MVFDSVCLPVTVTLDFGEQELFFLPVWGKGDNIKKILVKQDSSDFLKNEWLEALSQLNSHYALSCTTAGAEM